MKAFGFIPTLPRIRGLGDTVVLSGGSWETGDESSPAAVTVSEADAAYLAEIDAEIANNNQLSAGWGATSSTPATSSPSWLSTFVSGLWQNTGQSAVNSLINRGIYGQPAAQVATASGTSVPVYNINGRLATLAPNGSLQYLPTSVSLPGMTGVTQLTGASASNQWIWIAGIAGALVLVFVVSRR
jgi:hypothetical protein